MNTKLFSTAVLFVMSAMRLFAEDDVVDITSKVIPNTKGTLVEAVPVLKAKPVALSAITKKPVVAKPKLPIGALKKRSKDVKRLFGPGITKTTSSESVTSLGVSPWRMVAGIILLLLMFAGLYWFLRRFGKRLGRVESSGTLSVVNRVQLDSRNFLVTVRLYEEELLLGVGPNGVKLLAKYMAISGVAIDAEDEIDNEMPVEKSDSVNSPFEPLMQNATKGSDIFKKAKDIV